MQRNDVVVGFVLEKINEILKERDNLFGMKRQYDRPLKTV